MKKFLALMLALVMALTPGGLRQQARRWRQQYRRRQR